MLKAGNNGSNGEFMKQKVIADAILYRAGGSDNCSGHDSSVYYG